MPPLLSIAIPAYNRPLWLERALRSVATDDEIVVTQVEIVVTDDSTSDDCAAVVKNTLKNWAGQWQYVRNSQRLGMTGNWNQAAQCASGQYVLILHDDDFLLPNGVRNIVETLQHLTTQYKALLFGVRVVNDQGKLLRAQVPQETRWLPPSTAVYRLLANSSFIRFPGMVIERTVFEDLGGFNAEFGGTADVEMWLRVLSREGLFCVSQATAAYTVHSNALTMDMFNIQTIRHLNQIFEKAERTQLLKPKDLNRVKSDFFHQFILAGTFRYLRRRKYSEALATMRLFQSDEIKNLEFSRKWFIARLIFSLVTTQTKKSTCKAGS